MKMLITPAWLRNKTKMEPDIDFDAGMPVHLLHSIDVFLPPDNSAAYPEEEKRTLHS